MARKPCIHIPGGLYHVVLRGNGGQAVFFTDQDRYQLYRLLQEGIARYRHRIHAFCCMTNHIHLAIQAADMPLAKIVQNLSFRYTRWVNQRERRMGHLFQGRYKAILVDADSYLLQLIRYIHLNPVRAKRVTRPQDYRWSGHRAYLGQAVLPWLMTDGVLGAVRKTRGDSTTALRAVRPRRYRRGSPRGIPRRGAGRAGVRRQQVLQSRVSETR